METHHLISKRSVEADSLKREPRTLPTGQAHATSQHDFIIPIIYADTCGRWLGARALVSFTCKETIIRKELLPKFVGEKLSCDDDRKEPVYHFGYMNDNLRLSCDLDWEPENETRLIHLKAESTSPSTPSEPEAIKATFVPHERLINSHYSRSMRKDDIHGIWGWDMVVGVEAIINLKLPPFLPYGVVVLAPPKKHDIPTSKHNWLQNWLDFFHANSMKRIPLA